MCCQRCNPTRKIVKESFCRYLHVHFQWRVSYIMHKIINISFKTIPCNVAYNVISCVYLFEMATLKWEPKYYNVQHFFDIVYFSVHDVVRYGCTVIARVAPAARAGPQVPAMAKINNAGITGNSRLFWRILKVIMRSNLLRQPIV